MKKLVAVIVLAVLASSCVSKKEYAALEAQHQKTKDELVAVKNNLTKCLIEKEKNANQVATLEGTILEDNEFATEEYAGAGLNYVLANPVQDSNANVVDVFVNGHRVFVESVNGTQVGLFDPGYSIDADDTVVFVYQF